MSKPFDHERVSELLPEFLDGSLAHSDATSIEEHLATCETCRQEADAVRFLRRPIEVPLSASERLTLEHRVMAGIADDTPAPVSQIGSRTGIGARVAQVLGAAAAVAVLGTLLYMGATGGGDDAAMSEGADSVDEQSDTLADREAPRRRKNRTDSISAASEAGGQGSGGAGGTSEGTTGFKGAPDPRFSVVDDPFTPARLQKLGESSLASVTFANYYSVDDAAGRNTLLEQLVAAAEGAAGSTVSSQVEECGAQVLDTEDPTIPTFGALGELDGKPVLVLGFAWTRRTSGPLDRYMVWAWERGSCATAVDFVDGRIETAG